MQHFVGSSVSPELGPRPLPYSSFGPRGLVKTLGSPRLHVDDGSLWTQLFPPAGRGTFWSGLPPDPCDVSQRSCSKDHRTGPEDPGPRRPRGKSPRGPVEDRKGTWLGTYTHPRCGSHRVSSAPGTRWVPDNEGLGDDGGPPVLEDTSTGYGALTGSMGCPKCGEQVRWKTPRVPGSGRTDRSGIYPMVVVSVYSS